MITAFDILNELVPTVDANTEVLQAVGWMEELRIGHLPLVTQEKRLLGMVEESALLNASSFGRTTVGEIQPQYEHLFVLEHTHIYTILAYFGEYQTEVIPVVNKEKKQYIGAVTQLDVFEALAKKLAEQPPSTTLVLRLDAIQYSMQEVSRLVETNNAKILSSFVDYDPQKSDKLTLTLRLNVMDLSYVVATFERFGYQVVARFDDVQVRGFEQERLDLLLKYLEL